MVAHAGLPRLLAGRGMGGAAGVGVRELPGAGGPIPLHTPAMPAGRAPCTAPSPCTRPWLVECTVVQCHRESAAPAAPANVYCVPRSSDRRFPTVREEPAYGVQALRRRNPDNFSLPARDAPCVP